LSKEENAKRDEVMQSLVRYLDKSAITMRREEEAHLKIKYEEQLE